VEQNHKDLLSVEISFFFVCLYSHLEYILSCNPAVQYVKASETRKCVE